MSNEPRLPVDSGRGPDYCISMSFAVVTPRQKVLNAVAFVAIVQALLAAFGRRGWLVGLLLGGIQLAASGLFLPAGSLPGPLAFLHPLLPMSWASDALATAIGGGTSGIGQALAVLAAWLLGALVVTMVVATRRGGGSRPDTGLNTGSQPRAAEAAAS